MKTWFNGSSPEATALRSKWGDYPSMWKEVLNWKGWKEARRAFVAHQQIGERGNGNANGHDTTKSNPVIKMEPGQQGGPSPTAHTGNEHSNNGHGESSVPRKRKSRWGTVSDDQPRKSRWDPPPAAGAAATTSTMPTSVPVQSHAQPSLPSSSYTNPSYHQIPQRQQPALPGLPGMPANLTPQQQQEMEKYQARLREVNEKLQVVEQEAMRVDALPRGHRERSPSPPPGKLLTRQYLLHVVSGCHTIVSNPLRIHSQPYHRYYKHSLRPRRQTKKYPCCSMEGPIHH